MPKFWQFVGFDLTPHKSLRGSATRKMSELDRQRERWNLLEATLQIKDLDSHMSASAPCGLLG